MMKEGQLERIITAAIAMILIVGTLVIAIYGSITGKQAPVPDWLYSSTTLVIGYYFGTHKGQITGSSGNGNGTKAKTGGGTGGTH
jgi:hypothetical protein